MARKVDGQAAGAVSDEFARALMRQTLKTELLRIKALIASALLFLAASVLVDLLDPKVVAWIWPTRVGFYYVHALMLVFISLEVAIHFRIEAAIRRGVQLPIVWRYVAGLIETSLPTIVLVLQI